MGDKMEKISKEMEILENHAKDIQEKHKTMT